VEVEAGWHMARKRRVRMMIIQMFFFYYYEYVIGGKVFGKKYLCRHCGVIIIYNSKSKSIGERP
jgi:hypothetical protein